MTLVAGIRAPEELVPLSYIIAARLIFRHGWIDLIGPGQNAAGEVVNLAEPGLLQEIDSFSGAFAAAAMRHDFARRVEFVHAARQLAERNQFTLEIANLVFVRLAHIQNEDVIAFVEARLQFGW